MKPRDFARRGSKADPDRKAGTCRVIVALARTKEAPSPAVLARLAAAGLVVEQVIEDTGTLIGSISADAISLLESDESVTAVERSEELGLHE